MKRALIPVLLVVVTAILYFPRLGTAPIYLMPDEVIVAVDAHAIATTGRDVYHGRVMPLYIQYTRFIVDHYDRGRGFRESWLPPVIFYATALALKFLPFSETSIRVPTAIVGVLSVLLTYFVGCKLFRNRRMAILAAVFLALTPSLFIHSRMAADYLYPVPFMLAWLLCLLTYLERGSERMLFAAGLCLGIGLYSYAASTMVMPLYLAVTMLVLLRERRPARAYVVAALGFLLPASLCIPWLIQHPTMVSDVLNKYDLNQTGQLSALQSLRARFTYHQIGDEISFYWGFFNPRFLFFDGPMEPMYSTRQVGVFLLPVGAFLIAGLYAAIREGWTRATFLLLLGFFVAPVAATLVNVNDAIYRALEMLPFAALLAAGGAQALWSVRGITPSRRVFLVIGIGAVAVGGLYGTNVFMSQGRVPGGAVPCIVAGGLLIALAMFADRLRFGQMIVVGLLALAPIQFAFFYADYFTDYRVRSELVFSGNIRGAYEEVLRASRERDIPAIYLGEIASGSYGLLYWKFYLIKHGRQDLADRTINAYLFYPDQVLKLPSGSLIVTNAGDGAADAIIDRLIAAGELKKTAVITEPDGTKTFLVLQRVTAGK